MYKRSLIFTALALAAACGCTPLLANEMPASETTDHHLASGIHEVADDELATMRGRYTVGDNTVVWFGVEMISTWQTSTGQTLQSAATLAMNFSKNGNQPQVTFVPTVTITTANAALPTSTVQSTINRSVQSGGIANVGGLTQSVQIAGDNNATSNVTSLNIQNGSSSSTNNSSNTVANSTSSNNNDTNNLASTNTSSNTTSTNTGVNTPTGRTATVGDASASSTYSNNSAQINLSVGGAGSVSQWIHAGSLGQTIALTADNQVVTNQMIVNLVTQSIASTTQLVARNLSQSLNLSHTIGH